jgi:CheY-like chemotaxis protein
MPCLLAAFPFVRVPRRRGRPSSAALARRSVRDTMAHILIADDEEDLRQTIRYLLESEGHTVSEAADGQRALTMVRDIATPMVVILDVLMPLLNGIDLLRSVAADSSLTRRHAYLLLTANHRTLIEAAAPVLSALGVGLIRKPFDIDALVEDVARAAARLP